LSGEGSGGRSGRSAARLGLLFGALAFCQGVAEPTEGLIAQPVQSLLTGWGHGPAEVAAFVAMVALPWSLKPIYGLLTDFVPLFGRRRQGYLILTSGSAAFALFGLALLPTPSTSRYAWLLGWLAVATVAWSFSDVVADALMIDRGRTLGLVGRFQAIQWASMYAAEIVTGFGGGWLSRDGWQHRGFLICALASSITLLLSAFAVREPRATRMPLGAREAGRALARAARSPRVLGAGAFLFLWNFNPFATVVLRLHVTRTLGLGEAFYGTTRSAMAVGSILACGGYALLGRRVPTPRLVRLSIVLGVASTLLYGWLTGPASAIAVSLLVGLTYMAATLIQLDLAARACPPEAAGSVFALLMALENLAASTSTGLGGWCYERGLDRWGAMASFHLLVILGATFTASSWLLLPMIREVESEGTSSG
jgi:MFS family permease